MHRVRTLHILTTACASGGLACYLLTAAIGGRAGLAAQWVAPALLAMAAVAACAAWQRFRRSCRDLARQLQAVPSTAPAELAGASRAVASSDPAVRGLVSALNDVLRSADRAAAEAAAKVRELEIRLKVATAERTHAEAILYSHDVTRQKEISDMKSEFVSMVSHELRTPLASIKAYIEMLIDGEAVDERTTGEFYDVIQNEANRLGRLIDNILNISRIESGLVRADKRPQSLTVLVKEALEVMAPQLAQKGIRVVEDLPPVFYHTEGDRDMLYQALLNLLSNSVKYTPSGGTVTVRIEADEAASKIVTRIIDTGVGVPAQDLPFVFEKFYRAEANAGMAQGTGLGLSLVKQIIETIHQGQVFVESQVGKGSTFGFELKLYK